MEYDAEKERAHGRRTVEQIKNDIDAGNFRKNFRWESYSEQFLEAIRTCRVYVDCGAEFGFYSYLAVKHAPADCKIFAFEPEQARFEVLSAFMRPCHNVSVLPYGISSHTGVERAYKPGVGASMTVDPRISQYVNLKGAPYVEFKTIALDEYFKGTDIDVLKMDIEGAEVQAFEGLTQILAAGKTTCFMEVHSKYITSIRPDGMNYLGNMVAQNGYRCFDHKDMVVPFQHGRVVLRPPTWIAPQPAAPVVPVPAAP